MNNQYSISTQNEIQILKVKNLFNEFVIKDILKAAQAKFEKGFSKFVVDLSAIDYMNSVGLNLLINLKTKSKDIGGQIAVASASDKIIRLLEITKLKPMFCLTATVDEAIQSLSEASH